MYHTDQFRLLLENVKDYAIFLFHTQGYLSSWNTGAAHIKSYAAAESIDQHFSHFYPPEALTAHTASMN